MPFVWKVIKHSSSSVGFDVYRELLDEANRRLPFAFEGSVIFLADRGFADTELMGYLSRTLKWHYRIRIKNNFLVKRPGQRKCKVSRIKPKAGEAHFLHNVTITAERFGPVHLALAKLRDSREEWLIASDQPTSLESFDEYGLRFDIEENFLDDKSNGFQRPRLSFGTQMHSPGSALSWPWPLSIWFLPVPMSFSRADAG